VPATPKQSADAARKRGRKQRIFYRSKVLSGTFQSTATAQCAETAVSKQTANDTQAQALTRRDKQTCRPTASPTGEQTVCSKPIVHDGCSTQERGWFTIKQIFTYQKRGSRMFHKVEWETGETSWVPQKDVSEYAKDIYWL